MANDALSELYGEPVSEEAEEEQDPNLNLVNFVLQCKQESEDARFERDERNRVNYDVAHCRTRNSKKIPGQSQEFLPDTALAVEQLRAFIKNGLLAFSDLFQVTLSPDPELMTPPGQPPKTLTGSNIEKLLLYRLEHPSQRSEGCTDFTTTISDAIYTGALSSLMVLKVHGEKVLVRRPSVDFRPITKHYKDPLTGEDIQDVEVEEELVLHEGYVWKLLIELVRTEDYFPDPTGRGLYEIQRTRRDLYQVIDSAEANGYDKDVLLELSEGYESLEVDEEIERENAQSPTTQPHWRREVELLEFWGNILDDDGYVVHRNVRMVVANGKHVLLPPEPNPFWHQKSPFVVSQLIRVPFSVFHKALFDDAVHLNLAKNEIFNLMLDGAMAAVWGTKQINAGLVANMEEFADGIPQGSVFILKDEAPPGAEVVRQIDSGTVPPESMGMLQLVKAEYESATKINSIQMGQLPKKDVRATEVAISQQSTDQFFGAMIAEIERTLIEPVLHLAWLVSLQNCDDWTSADVRGILGPEAATALATMSPASRYLTYGQGAAFRARGLSSNLARDRQFQKLMAVLALVSQSPMLLQAFMQDSSPRKLLHYAYKSLNLDPEDIKITEEELAALPDTINQLPQFQMGGGGGGMATQMAPEQQPGAPMQGMQAGIDRLQQPSQELA